MEKAFQQYLAEKGAELSAEQFALFMNSMYPVDAYVRDYFRKAALDELLTEKLPVTVIGEGWEKYKGTDAGSLRRERAVPFALSFERIAKAHILLNVSPIFNRGMHDRIPAGMANHTVVLTDENPWLSRRFADGEEIAFYSLENLSTLGEQAGRLLGDRAMRSRLRSVPTGRMKQSIRGNAGRRRYLKWRMKYGGINTYHGGRGAELAAFFVLS